MIRLSTCAAAALAAGLFAAAPAFAQGAAAPAPTEPPPASPPPLVPAPPPAPVAVVATPAAEPPAASLAGAIGFGVGIIPNAELVGTASAVSLKYWVHDQLALAPLLSFAYDKPSDTSAAWHLRPEVLVLFVPLQGRSTRLEVGAGIGFQVGRLSAPVTPPGSGYLPTPDTTWTLSLPIQAGVEHFFARWFSIGVAARTDLFAYTDGGTYHEVSLSIDSTSLLAQLFFYTD